MYGSRGPEGGKIFGPNISNPKQPFRFLWDALTLPPDLIFCVVLLAPVQFLLLDWTLIISRCFFVKIALFRGWSVLLFLRLLLVFAIWICPSYFGNFLSLHLWFYFFLFILMPVDNLHVDLAAVWFIMHNQSR